MNPIPHDMKSMTSPRFPKTIFFIVSITSLLMVRICASADDVPFRNSNWIGPSEGSHQDFGVFVFRKVVELEMVPDVVSIKISADNRFLLYVNGVKVLRGPSRGDYLHWNFDEIDLAPYLKRGKNLIAVQVWNFGAYKPGAQLSRETALIIDGPDWLRSNASWEVYENTAYAPEPLDREAIANYIITDPGIRVDGANMPWKWETGEDVLSDSDWKQANELERGYPFGVGVQGKWCLVKNEIPPMEETPQHYGAVRYENGVDGVESVIAGKHPLTIPANQQVCFLLDQNHLTTAYPNIEVSGGANASIRATYAESLFVSMDSNLKDNRDEVEGKVIKGVVDVFLPNGSAHQLYQPLRFRTFRYVKYEIETGDEPLVIHKMDSDFTGYPLQENAKFSSNQKLLDSIWTVGWRTQRLCANEIFYDCPYYEQMMYIGDARIQALISLYVSGDSRLPKKSIDMIHHSLTYEGLTTGCVPSDGAGFIPPFSLIWILMVEDYFQLTGEEIFVVDKLDAMDRVLTYFEKHSDLQTGLYQANRWWNFVDWAWPWNNDAQIGGIPPLDKNGISAVLNLQWVMALQASARMQTLLGDPEVARRYSQKADSILKKLYLTCWNEAKQLLSDTPDQKEFSQHANALWILANQQSSLEVDSKKIMERVLNDASLTQCTFYFRFYLHEALRVSGLGDQFVELLFPWEEMLNRGLTTFAENPDPTRSDCHAWSASPNYHFLSLVCGIRPSAPGFESVILEPALGNLPWIEGSMPTPRGDIRCRFERQESGGISGWVDLPDDMDGVLKIDGRVLHIKGPERYDIQ